MVEHISTKKHINHKQRSLKCNGRMHELYHLLLHSIIYLTFHLSLINSCLAIINQIQFNVWLLKIQITTKDFVYDKKRKKEGRMLLLCFYYNPFVVKQLQFNWINQNNVLNMSSKVSRMVIHQTFSSRAYGWYTHVCMYT